jgi:hypothetical protein
VIPGISGGMKFYLEEKSDPNTDGVLFFDRRFSHHPVNQKGRPSTFLLLHFFGEKRGAE